jgi:hypothetical protein
MAQTYETRRTRRTSPESTELSGWAVGWTLFAALMLSLQGIWWMLTGLVGIVEDEFYVVGQEYIFQFDITTWGWTHLVFGVVLLAAGMALLTGSTWARVVGVVVASFAMILAFAWLPWYPLWALLFVAVSIAVIWALTVHGREVAREIRLE